MKLPSYYPVVHSTIPVHAMIVATQRANTLITLIMPAHNTAMFLPFRIIYTRSSAMLYPLIYDLSKCACHKNYCACDV